MWPSLGSSHRPRAQGGLRDGRGGLLTGPALAVKQGSPPLGAFEKREAVLDLILRQVNQRALQGD